MRFKQSAAGLALHVYRRRRLAQQPQSSRRVLFIDAGTYKDGRQIGLVRQWLEGRPLTIIGFEAHPLYAEKCRERFKADRRVEIVNAALIGPRHVGESTELFLDERVGLGDSLVGAGRSIKVPAVRLSAFLAARSLDPADYTSVLRMNIEGAEEFVIEDLSAAGMLEKFAGFYGSWNDVAKHDATRGIAFGARLRQLGVDHLPFNDQQSGGLLAPLKEAIIRADLLRLTS